MTSRTDTTIAKETRLTRVLFDILPTADGKAQISLPRALQVSSIRLVRYALYDVPDTVTPGTPDEPVLMMKFKDTKAPRCSTMANRMSDLSATHPHVTEAIDEDRFPLFLPTAPFCMVIDQSRNAEECMAHGFDARASLQNVQVEFSWPKSVATPPTTFPSRVVLEFLVREQRVSN